MDISEYKEEKRSVNDLLDEFYYSKYGKKPTPMERAFFLFDTMKEAE